MKAKIQLIILVVLLSGCTTCPLSKKKDSGLPSPEKTNDEMLGGVGARKTAESSAADTHPDPTVGIATAGSWIVDFNSEHWDSTVFTREVGPAPRVVYKRRSVMTASQESVVDECKDFGFGSYDGIGKFAEDQMRYRVLRDHLNVKATRILYESPTEVLEEWWMSESLVGRYRDLKVPASHTITLYRYDPDRCRARGIEPCVFVLTYSVNKMTMNETRRATWIERLRSARLR